jgi:hypothetical protein
MGRHEKGIFADLFEFEYILGFTTRKIQCFSKAERPGHITILPGS